MTTLMNSFSDSSSESMPNLKKRWKEIIADYRFFNNKNIAADKILSSHKEAILDRIKAKKSVLIAQDMIKLCFYWSQKDKKHKPLK